MTLGPYEISAVEAAIDLLGLKGSWVHKGATHYQMRTGNAILNYYNGKGTLMFQGKDGKQLEQQLISAFQRIGRQPGAVPTAKRDLKRGRPEEDATPIPKRQKAERMPQGATAESSNHIVTVDDDVRNTALIAVPTKPAIARSGAVVIYVDGSCLGNVNVRQTAQPAGWGVYITGAHNFELYGPVITDPKSPFFYGAECCSNNTAELSAMVEALLWLLSSSVATATMCYDSKYAAMIMTMVYRAHKNVELAGNLQKLYVQAKKVMKISIKKVKGHSNNPGNDAADRLANLGATGASCTIGRFDPDAKTTSQACATAQSLTSKRRRLSAPL